MEPDLDEIISLLSATPATLRGLLAHLPAPWLETNEGDGTFSPLDVLGHLIHGEQTDWMPRIGLILKSGEQTPFPPFDRHGFQETLRGKNVDALLDEFERLRRSGLKTLQGFSLDEQHLRLKGRHPEFGLVTLGQLLSTWVVHDLNHVGQIVRVMSRNYADAVGPWKAYLGILKR